MALKKLRAEGMSAAAIAEKMGCTRNAVIGKMARIGMLRRIVEMPTPRPKPKPKPKAPAPRPVRAVKDVPRIASILELTERTCKWPVGNPGSPGFGFCGLPKDGQVAGPYCEGHSRRARA